MRSSGFIFKNTPLDMQWFSADKNQLVTVKSAENNDSVLPAEQTDQNKMKDSKEEEPIITF